MKLPVIVVGAGGHGAVVADALLLAGERVLGLTDANPSRRGTRVCGLPILGDDETALAAVSSSEVLLANGIGIGGVGHGDLRRSIQQRLEGAGWSFVRVQHPAAVVSPFAVIGASSQLMASCVVQPGARVAPGCIVNTAAVVEHDVELGAFVHVAPAAVICGSARVGAHSHIGAGAVLRQGVQLGEHTLVGAGAVVVADFVGGGTLIGVPAVPKGGDR